MPARVSRLFERFRAGARIGSQSASGAYTNIDTDAKLYHNTDDLIIYYGIQRGSTTDITDHMLSKMAGLVSGFNIAGLNDYVDDLILWYNNNIYTITSIINDSSKI